MGNYQRNEQKALPKDTATGQAVKPEVVDQFLGVPTGGEILKIDICKHCRHINESEDGVFCNNGSCCFER